MLRRLRDWLAAAFRRAEPTTLRLYTKRDCPLCAALKLELARARVHPPFRLEEIDIEGDPELCARHGSSVPVLELAGRPLAKGRTSAAEFERRYARVLAEIRGGFLLRRGARRESRHG